MGSMQLAMFFYFDSTSLQNARAVLSSTLNPGSRLP